MLDTITTEQLTQLDASTLEVILKRAAWINPDVPKSARPDQLPPDMDDLTWFIWLQLGGRGSGKTRTGAEWAWDCAYRIPECRIAIVAPTSADVRKTCFEGESGIIAKMPKSLLADYNRQDMHLTLTNGSHIFGYSAVEPDRLRGPQHHFAWCDELAAWQYLDDALDNLLMGLRLGVAPRMIATTTPRPIKRLKEIVADKTTRIDRVSTYANKDNLPGHFINTVLKRYEGTRLGRQELMAEIIDDVAGALWTRANLDELRMKSNDKLPEMEETVVSVDPSVSAGGDGDECGIVVAARGYDKKGYLLADETIAGSPAEWARAAVLAYDAHQADWLVYEANQGGAMVAETIISAARQLKAEGKRDTDFVALKDVYASKGKTIRAAPVSALYEQKQVRHVGMFSTLEDQMCEFTPDFDRKKAGYSPDRLDAMVWAFTRLMTGDGQSGIREFYRQEAEAAAKQGALEGRTILPSLVSIRMTVPPGVRMALGASGKRYLAAPDGTMVVELESDAVGLEKIGFRRA